MKRTQHTKDQVTRICGAQMVGETSNLQRALNTGWFCNETGIEQNYSIFAVEVICLWLQCHLIFADTQINVDNMVGRLNSLRGKEKNDKVVSGKKNNISNKVLYISQQYMNCF